MKNKKFENSKIGTFLRENSKAVFCGASIVLALLVDTFMKCNILIFSLAVVSSLIVYLRLPSANFEIHSKAVRLGWACINFALFIAMCKLGTYSLLSGDEYAGTYVLGGLGVLFLNTLLYGIVIPITSQKMGWIICSKLRSNGMILSFAVHVLMFFLIVGVYDKEKKDAQFEQEEFVPVLSWEKEVLYKNTIFIVKTEKGTFGIYPKYHPEIRNINANTQIRVLASDSYHVGLRNYYRIEIKN